MARRTEFPQLNEGDGSPGSGSPGVLAAKYLTRQVLAERNKKRGLNRAPASPLTGVWDNEFTTDLVVTKQYAGLKDVNGDINPHTIGRPAWEYLWDFAKGKRGGKVNALVVGELKPRPTAAKALTVKHAGTSYRTDVVAVAEKMCVNGRLYSYNQARPFPTAYVNAILMAAYYARWDCSSSVLGWYMAAGIPNPLLSSGKYDGYGHTGTLWAAGVRVPTARPGDFVFYGDDYKLGYWRPQHVAMALDASRIATFGSNPPRITSINYRTDRRGIVDVLG